MDLSQQTIHDAVHPTAAFSEIEDEPLPSQDIDSSKKDDGSDWQHSYLNPKNRIDSLEVLENPLWRIDGCTAFGSQFYAVPQFVNQLSPMRVDVFTPEPAKLPEPLRDILDVDVAFHTTSASRIASLGITRHILRILQCWTASNPGYKEMLKDLPFGSRIVLKNFPVNVDRADIIIAPTHYLERQLLSVPALQQFWGAEVRLPPTVGINDITYLSQLHDSVCLVEFQGQRWIFKALTSYTKYLYHELRQLLTIQPHANIITRPAHLVTKKCGFGSKQAVVGFTLEYHIYGSLRDLIPFLRIHDQVSLVDQTKWAIQLTSALAHLRETSNSFYPDLRLDNIVLSASRDVVMVDFEQRGVWCEFAAPEVNALEYVRLLAIDEDIPLEVSEKYSALLTQIIPGWRDMNEGEEYTWPSKGYNVPWACLTPVEQEACEVYMLGRVLWCIFESTSAPQRAAVWLSYKWEPGVEFPGYTRTPEPMRRLIDHCTRGRQKVLGQLIVRERTKLVLRKHENTGLSTAREVQRAAKDWWSREIDASENWLRRRLEGMAQMTWKENYYDRPSIREVLSDLERFRDECVATQGNQHGLGGARKPPS